MIRKRRLWRVCCIAAGFYLTGCSNTPLSEFASFELHQAIENPASHFYGVPVRSGQVIVSAADSPLSFMISLMANEYAPYGHAGIIIVESDGVYVYDGFAYLDMKFWQPPTQRLQGSIRRVELSDFLNRVAAARIYSHPSLDQQAVAEFAIAMREQKIPFDGFFDYRTRQAMYCSEFVAAALAAGGYSEQTFTGRTRNASMNRAMDWLEISAPKFILTSDLLHSAIPVASFSRRLSDPERTAREAFDAELHRRFSADQALGNVFRWTPTGPKLRAHLSELRREILRGATTAPDAKQWAVTTIRQTLGPVRDYLAAPSVTTDSPTEQVAAIETADFLAVN